MSLLLQALRSASWCTGDNKSIQFKRSGHGWHSRPVYGRNTVCLMGRGGGEAGREHFDNCICQDCCTMEWSSNPSASFIFIFMANMTRYFSISAISGFPLQRPVMQQRCPCHDIILAGGWFRSVQTVSAFSNVTAVIKIFSLRSIIYSALVLRWIDDSKSIHFERSGHD